MTHSASRRRYDVLDGLRGIAATMVMVYHFTLFGRWPLFPNGNICVDLFFILSGFVIFHSYGEKLANRSMSHTRYLAKRLIRLYPMLVISSLIGIPTLVFINSLGLANFTRPGLIAAAASNVLMIPYLGDRSINNMGIPGHADPASASIGSIFPINDPAWSLFFEIVASGLFLLFVRANEKKLFFIAAWGAVTTLLIALLVELNAGRLALQFGLGWGTSNFLGGFSRVVYGFAMGILVYRLHLRENQPALLIALRKWIPSEAALYGLFAAICAFPYLVRGIYPFSIIFTIAPILVWRGAELDVSSTRSSHLTRLLGRLSYPIYLLHFPIGRLVFALSKSGQEAQAVFISIIATLIAAWLVERFVDHPIRQWLEQSLVRRNAPASQAEARPNCSTLLD
ncbi:acyltransferase [Paraburkholderia sp. Ac-20347]|uniref:acyltransferase family protein n=1 Tax=Paraburkholderia sp. Ac-20347 TaxID=2703892 RepID=UPI00198096EA|nr:acyltransferase [Paraburkholderia sp. Ac-20347]MBN3809361.1 acyltransferase [Paraburkholderia sp. Ac-20347]